MFFRFTSAVVLVVLIALAGIAWEKQNLAMRRAISRQQYQMDILLESYARLRLKTQQMGDPRRLLEAIESGRLPLQAAPFPDQGPKTGQNTKRAR
ncbi:MAG TPA: hypothetical protein EYP14_16345 [Planctomycetaceae bacterium]|nr:hypothetical protein [Planctomycetaceae bacterium]